MIFPLRRFAPHSRHGQTRLREDSVCGSTRVGISSSPPIGYPANRFMTIRPATPEDVPGVLPMVEKICALHESWDPQRYGFLPNIASMYRGWLTNRARDPKSVFLVAQRDDGQLVAFLVGSVDRGIPIYR